MVGSYIHPDLQVPGIAQAPGIVEFTPRQTDAQIAEDMKVKVAEHLTQIIALMDEAGRSGMIISFQLSSPDALKRHHIANLEILKRL